MRVRARLLLQPLQRPLQLPHLRPLALRRVSRCAADGGKLALSEEK